MVALRDAIMIQIIFPLLKLAKHFPEMFQNAIHSMIDTHVTNVILYSMKIPQGSLSHISATHPCAHTSKSAPKWRNMHHQILHP